MKQLIVFMIVNIVSCKAQDSPYGLRNENNEVLKVFLTQQSTFSYVDRNFFNKNFSKHFSSSFKTNKRFYKNADSICRVSSDTTKLKFYCSLADSFKTHSLLLKDEDLDFLIRKYDKEKEAFMLNLDSLLFDTTLRQHSDNYYKKIDYNKYDGIPAINEFPSIRIYNLYFNESKNIAIVVYSIVSERINSTTLLYYLLEKKDGIWWKPLGSLKL